MQYPTRYTFALLNPREEINTTSAKLAPGPKPAPLIGNMREMNKLGIIGFGHHVWKEYGDVSRFQFGPMRTHLFTRPEHVKHILVEHRENYTKGASHDKLRMWLDAQS
ncbi:MAG: cytochrome P450 [Anaerolineales bacterium]|nr:cytochrome P450 [Anaerolineales bacterium]